jgi:hypothetical protein
MPLLVVHAPHDEHLANSRFARPRHHGIPVRIELGQVDVAM